MVPESDNCPMGPEAEGCSEHRLSVDPPYHCVADEVLLRQDSDLSSQPQRGTLPVVDNWLWCVQLMLQVPRRLRHKPMGWGVGRYAVWTPVASTRAQLQGWA